MWKSNAFAFILFVTEKANNQPKILSHLPSTFSKCPSTSFKQISEYLINISFHKPCRFNRIQVWYLAGVLSIHATHWDLLLTGYAHVQTQFFNKRYIFICNFSPHHMNICMVSQQNKNNWKFQLLRKDVLWQVRSQHRPSKNPYRSTTTSDVISLKIPVLFKHSFLPVFPSYRLHINKNKRWIIILTIKVQTDWQWLGLDFFFFF